MASRARRPAHLRQFARKSNVEWTPDGLLRHVVYLGERGDKLASEVRRTATGLAIR
jgi:hypothetical protein